MRVHHHLDLDRAHRLQWDGVDVLVGHDDDAPAAELLGKPAALFVASGTMGNQSALRALSQPGDVLLAGEDAHILLYEAGAASALWGVQVKTLGNGGLFDGAADGFEHRGHHG